MYEHPNTAFSPLQAEQLLLSIKFLDDDSKATITGIIMHIAHADPSTRQAIAKAMQQQREEQQELDAWLDFEAARHTDPHICSKEGDIAYWVGSC